MADDCHLTELVPAFVLGCLEQDEARQVAAHLAGCRACRAELAAYQSVVDRLALAVPEVEPPPRLKHAVLHALPPRPGPAAPPRRVSGRQSLASLFRRSAPAWGLVSLVLIVVLGVSTAVLWQRLDASRLATSVGDMPVVALLGTEAAPGARGVIVMSENGRYGTLVVDDLAPLDDAYQYQLWLIQPDGERVSGGVFDVDKYGYGALEVWSREDLASFPEFGVTIEPTGGSPGPTGPKVLGRSL